MSKLFNIRVYAIIVNDKNEVLLTDEYRFGMQFTKFPGGGLEHGEGPIDCIIRECMEELNQEVEVTGHFYTTDFYQQSAFREDDQIISIYYRVRLIGPLNFITGNNAFEFAEKVEGSQVFRWRSLTELSVEELTFPIDKKVAGRLLNPE